MKFALQLLKTIFFAGILAFSSVSNANASCGIPSNLHITNLTTTSGLFVWNNASNATSYVLRYRPVGSSTWHRQNSGNNTELVTGLLPNTYYEAKVRSDCDGDEGTYSALYHFTTLSTNPCNLPNVYYFTSDNITSNSTLVGWKRVSGATSYNVRMRIRYSNAAWTNAGSTTTTSLQLLGLLPSTQYEFEVQTVCNAGTAPYSSYGIFTTHASSCGAPANLIASGVTDSTASVSWTALSCAAYYFVNIREQGQSTWASDTTSSPFFSFDSLTEGNSYEVQVQSVDTNGSYSGYSQTYVFSTSSSSCGTATNLTAGAITTGSAALSWDSVPGNLMYTIRYRLAGAQVWQLDSTATNSYSATGLTADNVYEFQIQSRCSFSTGSFSAVASFITLPNAIANIPVPDHVVICIMENKAYSHFPAQWDPKLGIHVT